VSERFAPEDTRAEEELEGLALKGLDSGESILADEAYWQEKRRGLVERDS
jgi:hypothetical protein